MIRTPVRVGIGLACVCLSAACTSSKPTRIVTVTRTHSPSPTATLSTSAAPSTGSATTSPTSPAATAPSTLTKLPGTCDTLLPDSAVEDALGAPLPTGSDAFVVGVADPQIGRVGYLNCRYGVTGHGAAATPALEIGVSLYRTPARAAARITATADDYTAHGAQSSDTTVEGTPATLLTGGTGAGYDVPLLVLASGQRTVAVSVGSTVATGAKATQDAKALAVLALRRTGG